MKDNPQALSNAPEVLELTRLQNQMQRPARNVNIDGGFELGWGTALLCFSLVPYVNAVLPRSFWSSAWTAWLGYLPLVCAGFAPYAIPKMIKRFITWPRTGYVAMPNEITLIQLVLLMVFGSVLGLSLGVAFILVSELPEAISQPGKVDWQRIIWHGVKFLVCASLAVYLGRKTIRKRQPLPGAYDAVLVNERLGQTVAGRKTLRWAKVTLFLLFVGIPLFICGAVFGFVYLAKSATRHTELHWPELGVLSFLVATNAILYLMGNGIALRQQRWKWLVPPLMVIVSIFIAPVIPYPAVQPELTTILKSCPPVMLCVGTVWFLSGGITLISFIRHNPLPSGGTA